jgi:hypothetical protein
LSKNRSRIQPAIFRLSAHSVNISTYIFQPISALPWECWPTVFSVLYPQCPTCCTLRLAPEFWWLPHSYQLPAAIVEIQEEPYSKG